METFMSKAKSPDNDTVELIADNLQADLVGWLIDRLRHMECAYRYLTEDQQRTVIREAQYATRSLVEEVVRKVAAEDRQTIVADLKKVTRDADKIVGQLECAKHSEYRHNLVDAVGSQVLIVVADPEQYMGGDMPEPDPDQPDLGPDEAA